MRLLFVQGGKVKIELGKTVTDAITGFKGIVTGRCEYITGCNQALVTPRAKETGEAIDGRWIDEDRLQIEEGIPAITLPRTSSGFDAPAPVR